MKHRINVKGAIIGNDDKWIYDLFEMEATCPNDIINSIAEANGADLEIVINSGGGSVYDASEIYTELKSYPGNVETQIVGLAASAASVIAMAGDKVKIAPTGEMMIHNCSMMAWGDYRDMDRASEMLQNTNKAIANAYRLKSGMSEEDLLAMMDKESWLTPQSCLEYGLVDEIMFQDAGVKLSASANVGATIPQKVIEGMRNTMVKGKQDIVDKDVLKNALDELKAEILNELKPVQSKEPDQVPTNKRNVRKLFLNLN